MSGRNREVRKKRVEARNKRMANRNKRMVNRDDQKIKEEEAHVKKMEQEQELLERMRNVSTKDKLTVEVAIHCYNYQHRLCWMLSSILQQKGDLPNIIVSISYAPNNGNPNTEKVCKFFRKKGLTIKEFELTEKEASNRAIARNKQVADTTADWIVFADSDMVYDPYFFEDIQKQVKGKFATETRCIGADRVSLNIPFCIKFFEDDKKEYPSVISEVVDICKKWPVKSVMGKNVAAGYFQLASVEAINNKGRKYTGKQNDHWRGTRSDRQFRTRMGGRVPIDTKKQYHLNHDRGGPEIQR